MMIWYVQITIPVNIEIVHKNSNLTEDLYNQIVPMAQADIQ